MRINRVAIVLAVLIAVLLIPIFCEPVLAVYSRAEVPGATITGIILDAGGHNVPNATVRLLKDGQLFDIPGNPQQSNDIPGPYTTIGRYQFMRLPYGEYLIRAEIADAAGIVHGTNLSIAVNANTTTADIVIPDLSVAMPATPWRLHPRPHPGHPRPSGEQDWRSPLQGYART